LKNGYNVISFDFRGHGKSTVTTCTLGENEKKDIKEIVDYLRNTYGKSIDIGIIGNSMGGATIIEYLKRYKNPHISFAIIDGCFSKLSDQIK